jgi:hypothetical protein
MVSEHDHPEQTLDDDVQLTDTVNPQVFCHQAFSPLSLNSRQAACAFSDGAPTAIPVARRADNINNLKTRISGLQLKLAVPHLDNGGSAGSVFSTTGTCCLMRPAQSCSDMTAGQNILI